MDQWNLLKTKISTYQDFDKFPEPNQEVMVSTDKDRTFMTRWIQDSFDQSGRNYEFSGLHLYEKVLAWKPKDNE